jgi:hypothetical protein
MLLAVTSLLAFAFTVVGCSQRIQAYNRRLHYEASAPLV